MKKTITLLLTLCLLLGLLPTEAVAFAGDIYRAGDVTAGQDGGRLPVPAKRVRPCDAA